MRLETAETGYVCDRAPTQGIYRAYKRGDLFVAFADVAGVQSRRLHRAVAEYSAPVGIGNCEAAGGTRSGAACQGRNVLPSGPIDSTDRAKRQRRYSDGRAS
ncbi:hypothetical protein MTO96_011575 [Rhipicephalus appendiculatus]